jgi:hypothetical protein
MAHRGANAWDFVCRDGNSYSGSAEQDSSIMFAFRDRLSDRERNVGIQNGFLIKDAIVAHRYTAIF